MSAPIAITCGDPAGVGLGLVDRCLDANPLWVSRICVIGPRAWAESFEARGASAIIVGKDSYTPEPGNPTEPGARFAWEALEIASGGVLAGEFSSVVTCPISKKWMQRVGFPFPGHTEFFAKRWCGTPTMAFVGESLTVALATWHIPFSRVPSALTPSVLEHTITSLDQLLKTRGIATPRIGVCGLNPHAGEQGLLGSEEKEWINPCLDDLRVLYPGLSDAQPADSLFWRHRQGEFDGIVALYHDQGLAPLKTLEFDSAVNITLGLKYIRTSPDHGTGFNIADKGIASFKSLHRAILLAGELSVACHT